MLVKPLEDVTPDSDTPAAIRARPGGAAANQAAWMAHLGACVTFAGRVGARDADYHRDELARTGVRPHLAVDLDAETGSIVIMVAPDGERTMFTDRGANRYLREDDLPDGLLDEAQVLHLTGYTFFEPALLEVALRLLARARSRDLAVTIDPGSAAFLARLEAGAFLRWTDGAAVCFPNRDEAAMLVGEADPVTMASPPHPALRRRRAETGRRGVRAGGARREPGPHCRLPGPGAGHHRRGRRVLRRLHEPVARGPPGPQAADLAERGGVRDAHRRLRRHPLRRPPGRASR